jgi:hypothetical protein
MHSPVQKLPDVIPGMTVHHHRHHPTTLLPGCCAGILQTLQRYGESLAGLSRRRADCWYSMTHDARQAIRREKMDLVTYHWSGKHHDVVRGINLITLLWSDGKALVPTDFRLYDKQVG